MATAAQEIVAEAAPGIIEDARPGIIEEVTPGIEARSRAEMLTEALESAFGTVPVEFRQRISKADKRDVNRWMTRFHKADSLDQIFNGSGKD